MRTTTNGNLPDRQTLYDQVWNKPLSHLAIDYDVKPWDIQNWCKQLHIPLPDRGYWSRQRHGLPTERLPLPEFSEDIKAAAHRPLIPLDTAEPIHFPKENELSFKVPDRLNNPDNITLDAKRGLETKRMDEHFVNTDDGQFPIRVAKSSVGRVLRILDTLVKCWKRRGYRIELHDRQALIWLREVRQRISIWEISENDPKNKHGQRKKMVPTGKLAIKMDWWGGRQWRDGQTPLEDQIHSILDHMERSARQLEREKANTPKTLVTTGVVDDKEVEQPVVKTLEKEIPQVKEAKPVAESQLPAPVFSPPPVAQTLPAVPAKAIPQSFITTPSVFDTLIAEAQQWKGLKVVDEYLTALQLTHPHTPEFVQWLENAKAIRKANDPLIKKLTES